MEILHILTPLGPVSVEMPMWIVVFYGCCVLGGIVLALLSKK